MPPSEGQPPLHRVESQTQVFELHLFPSLHWEPLPHLHWPLTQPDERVLEHR